MGKWLLADEERIKRAQRTISAPLPLISDYTPEGGQVLIACYQEVIADLLGLLNALPREWTPQAIDAVTDAELGFHNAATLTKEGE